MPLTLLVSPAGGGRWGAGPRRVPDWVWIILAVAGLSTMVALPWPGTAPRRLPMPSPVQAVHEAYGACLDDGPYEKAYLDVRQVPARSRTEPARYRIVLVPPSGPTPARPAVLELDTGARLLRPADDPTAGLLVRSGCPPAFWPATTGPS